MAFDADKAWVLWPEYFDIARTRAQGRRVKKNMAIPEPQMVMLVKAVDKLGLQYKIEEGKSYPSAWWQKQGLLLVENTMPKSQLLPKVAEKLKTIPRPQKQ
jgi:signal recognition particle subunit SRP19